MANQPDMSAFRALIEAEITKCHIQLGDAEIARVAELVSERVTLTEEAVDRIVADVTERAAESLPRPVQIVERNGAPGKVIGRTHSAFDEVLQLCQAGRNVLMIGPSGCGKTYLASQIADAMGVRFAYIHCSRDMSKADLLGRVLLIGGTQEYAPSELVDFYGNGGCFLFDEVDAADDNTTLVLNGCLDSEHLSVPNRWKEPVVKRHKDFVCLAAANTYGTGADRMYVGRNQLDEAFLDRFRIGQIEMDYDLELEREVCPDTELRRRLQYYRGQAKGLRRVVSTRFLRDAHLMKQRGWSDARVDRALFMGWSADEVAKVTKGASSAHKPVGGHLLSSAKLPTSKLPV